MSTALTWQLLRKHNSFIVKRKMAQGVEFSTEKGNLANVNSYKYSGLANDKAIDIDETDNGVALAVKSSKAEKKTKPSAMWVSSKLERNARRSARVISKKVSNTRPDLKKAALARFSAISNAQQRAAEKSSV